MKVLMVKTAWSQKYYEEFGNATEIIKTSNGLIRHQRILKKRFNEQKTEQLNYFLRNIGVSKPDESSLWKAIRYQKGPMKRNTPIKDENGVWCKTEKGKAVTFTIHFRNTFQPHDFCNNNNVNEIINFLESACPIDWSIKHVSPNEIQVEISKLIIIKHPDMMALAVGLQNIYLKKHLYS